VSAPVAGFRLAYGRQGAGEAVVLLHGWPGDRADWREVLACLGWESACSASEPRRSCSLDRSELDRLTSLYGDPGAFVASIGWYRAGAGTVATSLGERPPPAQERIPAPTTVLWPEHDPLFPREWGDRIEEFFSRVTVVTVHALPGAGHFSPLEAADRWAEEILAARADSV
jgi:pimeloyl-ACP methyl ester carboxylesterase